MKIIESNCKTGEVVERDMTSEEVAAAETAYKQWLEGNTPLPADDQLTNP